MRIFCSLPRTLVLGRYVQDAVGVDVERHLDLRHAARRAADASQLEAAKLLVLVRHRALALQHVDIDRRLEARGRGEDLALADGERRIALNDAGTDAAQRLDAERQRRHIEQQQPLHAAAEHARLQTRTWKDKHDQTRKETELNATNLYFGDTKKLEQVADIYQQGGNAYDEITEDDGELPF